MGLHKKVEMAARQVATKVPAWKKSVAKWIFNRSEFLKYGLMRDDVLNETPVVVEAIRRLPKHLQDERQFRISRALLLSCQKTILPKEEWSKYEDDVTYLQPYIKQIEAEIAEKREWSKK